MDAHKNDRLTYVTLVDAGAAEAAAAAGVGNPVKLRLGHSMSTKDGEPIVINGIVRTVSDGTYLLSAAGMTGAVMKMGLTAVVAVGSIRVAVRSIGGLEWDAALFTSVGLELGKAALVFVKSPSHFRASFGPMADRIIIADTPGPTTANMLRVPFKKVQRPIHPLDKL